MRGRVRRKKKLTTFCFLSFIKTHSNHQFGSNYRAIVAANKRNLGSPDRPLLAFTGKSYDDDDEDDEDGSAAADGDEPDAGGGGGGGNDDTAAAAAAAAAATAAADSTIPSGRCGGGFGGVGAGSSSGRRGGGGGGGDGSSAIKWKTTLSATPAATLAKSRKATSLQAAEWPAPSCADAQIVYLAFDILSLDGKCVAGRPLSERKELLRRAVVGEDEFLKEADDDVDGRSQRSIRTLLLSDSHEIPRSCADPGRRGGLRIGRTPGNPMRGRLLAMLPDAAPLHSLGAQPPRCERAATRAEVELAAKEAEKNLEEGIMIKSLASQWIPGAYRNAWVKMKPEYAKVTKRVSVVFLSFFSQGREVDEKTLEEKTHLSLLPLFLFLPLFFFRFFFSIKQDLDIDAIVLGGRYGKGKRGGVLSEFLLGLLYKKPQQLLEEGPRVGVSDRDRLDAAASVSGCFHVVVQENVKERVCERERERERERRANTKKRKLTFFSSLTKTRFLFFSTQHAKFISFCRVGTGFTEDELTVR